MAQPTNLADTSQRGSSGTGGLAQICFQSGLNEPTTDPLFLESELPEAIARPGALTQGPPGPDSALRERHE